jgi:thiosulfate/3-mercaptopyruvate sulfurtransferase
VKFAAAPRDELGASLPYLIDNLGRAHVRIFDVRSEAEYYAERVRARHGGAIPGAVHQDWTASNTASGKFKSPDELRAAFEKLGLNPSDEIVPYCQGGYRAAHALYALRLAGYEKVRNYWGSWGEWGNRDDVPIEHPRRK